MNFDTDFAALGLSDYSPFAILSKPRAEPKAHKTPKKRGPKPSKKQMTITALDSPEERKAKRMAAALKGKHANFHIGKESDSDKAKTARIIGKQNSRRSQ